MASMNPFTSDIYIHLPNDPLTSIHYTPAWPPSPDAGSWNLRQRDHDVGDRHVRVDRNVDVEDVLVLLLVAERRTQRAVDAEAAVDELDGEGARQAEHVAVDEIGDEIV